MKERRRTVQRRIQPASVRDAAHAAKLRKRLFLQGQDGYTQNPLRLLQGASSRRMLQLAPDEAFLRLGWWKTL